MPALTGALVRFTFGGRHYTSETWTNTLHLQTVSGAQPQPAQVENALGLYTALMGVPSWIDYWKWNQLAPSTGRYFETDSHTYELAPSMQGTRGLSIPQGCMVGSFGTAAKRGPAHAGRIYMPSVLPINSNGVATDTDAVAMRGQLLAFVNSVNNIIQGGRVGVWSQQYQSFRPITTVGVGKVADTQRSRRKSLKEGTVPVDVAA